jgi:hypothetical protein
MKQKGQAFSVFKLLIAAVVALSILAILIPILDSITDIGLNNPNEEAGDRVKALFSSPGEHIKSNTVTFQPETSLNLRSIAERSGVISAEFLCLNKGDFKSSPSFEYVPLYASGGTDVQAERIKYNGSSNLKAKLSIICDNGDRLVSFAEDPEGVLKIGNGTLKNQCPGIVNTGTQCLIVLRSNS